MQESQNQDLKSFSLRRYRTNVSQKISPETIRRFFPILALVALCLVFALRSPRFFSFLNLMIVTQQAAVLMVVSAGMTFVIIAGSVDLSVGSMTALAALTAASLSGSLGAAAIIPAALVGLLCGLFNGIIITKGKVPSFIATLGGMVIFRGLVLYYTRGTPVGIKNENFIDVFSSKTFGIPHSGIFAVIIAILAAILLNRAVFGREVRAIGGGERVALLTGINVIRTKVLIFALIGLLCGIAGVLQSARAMAATSQLAEGLEMDAMASVVVGGTPMSGGVGSMSGTILGVLIMTILSNGMNMLGVDPYLQNIIKGAVLIAAVFITLDRKKIGIIK